MHTNIPPIATLEWVREHVPDPVFADVRWYMSGASGREAYDAGHIPGAVFVDLDEQLAAPPSADRGRHPLPTPEAFATALGELGIGDDDTVVAYDDAGGVIAARLVWLLRATGRAASLLDGGIGTWPGPLETAAPERAPAHLTVREWPPELLASADDAADPANVVLDARERERYRGELEPIDPRAGHIPGARTFPCRENVGADGRLLDRDELGRQLAAAGVSENTPVISYCGSGVTACHTLLVLEHVGLGRGRLYPGSWSQWSADEERPVATGD